MALYYGMTDKEFIEFLDKTIDEDYGTEMLEIFKDFSELEEDKQDTYLEEELNIMPTKIYIGGPLFSEMEIEWNRSLEKRIKEKYKQQVEIYNPCNNEAINDKTGYANSEMIVDGDNAYLEESDIVIAQLDGVAVDAGLASEIGFAYAKGKTVLGLYTDSRQGTYGNQKKLEALEIPGENQQSYLNLYVSGTIKKCGEIFTSSQDLIEGIEKYLKGGV